MRFPTVGRTMLLRRPFTLLALGATIFVLILVSRRRAWATGYNEPPPAPFPHANPLSPSDEKNPAAAKPGSPGSPGWPAPLESDSDSDFESEPQYEQPTSQLLHETPTDSDVHAEHVPPEAAEDPDCKWFPDTSKIQLVMKTGASESRTRIPIHILTTLKCVPDVLIFSDHKETINGHTVYDSLDTVLESAKEDNPDFDLYRAQNDCQVDQASCTRFRDAGAEAWRLDKYKNIHMAEKSYRLRPKKDWFIFVDADTYIMWHTAVQWLSRLDPNKKLYMGSRVGGGDGDFAHGGSGYVVSRGAMKELVEKKDGTVANSWDVQIKKECCGDDVFARALKKNCSILLTNAWPSTNGEKPFTMNYGPGVWCHPVVTMHHLNVREISETWDWERKRNAQQGKNPTPVLMKEMYENFFQPLLVETIDDWDNMSDDRYYLDPGQKWEDWQHGKTIEDKKLNKQEKAAYLSFKHCKRACESLANCVSYTYQSGICRVGWSMRPGYPTNPKEERRYYSGWLVDRINEWVGKHNTCRQPEWTV